MSLVAPAGWASPATEAQAKELADDAMMNDYLMLKLDSAVEKLNQALELCGESECSPKLTARLHRDLGVVFVVGQQKEAEGIAQFVLALQTHELTQLDPDLTTPEAEAAFAKAREESGVPEPTAEELAAERAAQAEANKVTVGSGDIRHTPPSEQATMTPVPVYVELPEGATPTTVRITYHAFGVTTWKSMSLRRHKTGYAVEIPCLDVGSPTGDLSYFIEVLDGSTVTASLGSKEQPLTVAIRTVLEGEPPHLPGKPPPAQCQDAMDCPPEFPGCKGEEMSDDVWGEPGAEEAKASGPKSNWLTLSAQMDLLLLPGGVGVCSDSPPESYECYYSDGTHRNVGDPVNDQELYANPGGTAGELAGGFAPATLRVAVGYDRAFGDHVLVGARVGFAFNGGPTAAFDGARGFLPVHAELQGSYWFGAAPFENDGAHVYAKLGAGLAQVDGHLNVEIIERFRDRATNALTPVDEDSPRSTIEVWKKTGPVFVSVGPGFLYTFADVGGPWAEVKASLLFPDSGFALSGQAGWAYGF